MKVIEALRTTILEPRDDLHINHDRMVESAHRRPAVAMRVSTPGFLSGILEMANPGW
jgi:hypothetical protein